MKLKKSRIIGFMLSVFVIVVTIFSAVIGHKKNYSTLDNDCSAAVSIRDKSANFSARLNIYLSLHNDNTGYLDVVGKISEAGVSYTTARSWRFNYALQNGNTAYLTRLTMDKRAADDSPDGLVDRLIFSTDAGSGRYVKIAVLNNAWVIGNLYSPQFLCLIRDK